jgi:glycosyltransferase involved in cell wall biosynthesis
MKQSIAVFDYQVRATNPIGGCHLQMLRELSHEFNFTVFAVDFDNPCPERIRSVRIPVPRRPLVLLFLSYHLLAPLYYLAHRWKRKSRFDLIQMVESNLSFGTISYAQFCHRNYLTAHWPVSRPSGLRRFLRWLDHKCHAILEPFVYRRVRRIVVPCSGLARELAAEYRFTENKVHILPNPVDSRRMKPPSDFDRTKHREEVGASGGDTVLVFVALGHFERKGLPLILEALQRLGRRDLKLLVVGGPPGLIKDYQRRSQNLGLERQVTFLGMQQDVRPFLWLADALVFPTAYEVFSLASLECAAAGVPMILTKVNGVEEFVEHGRNGILIERSVEGIMAGIGTFLSLLPEARKELGNTAQRDVERYAVKEFVAGWRKLYQDTPSGCSPQEVRIAGIDASSPRVSGFGSR